MSLDMSWPIIETEDKILSVTKNCETPYKQPHTKPLERLEFKLTQPRETVSFRPSIIRGVESKWMIGLTNLEAYISILI